MYFVPPCARSVKGVKNNFAFCGTHFAKSKNFLQSDAVVFRQYQQLLTAGQWNFLIAIAKEGEVSQITARQFLHKYHLGNPSSVSRIVPSLVEKNLLDENVIDGKTIYSLNDVFLSRWLEENY